MLLCWEELEACFEGFDCVSEGFGVHDITWAQLGRVLWCPLAVPSRLSLALVRCVVREHGAEGGDDGHFEEWEAGNGRRGTYGVTRSTIQWLSNGLWTF